jgi:hypothetical protein
LVVTVLGDRHLPPSPARLNKFGRRSRKRRAEDLIISAAERRVKGYVDEQQERLNVAVGHAETRLAELVEEGADVRYRILAATVEEEIASHRRQLERQRDLLAGIWRWYLGPLVPGLVLFAVSLPFEQSRSGPRAWIGTAVVLSIGAAVFVGIARLNRMAARQLQRKIDALLPLEPPRS